MKKTTCLFTMFLFFACFFFAPALQAQDLIRTIDKREINCKILKVTNTEIQYTFAENKQLHEASIPLDSVDTFKYKHFKDEQSAQTEKLLYSPSYEQIMLGVDVGPGYKFSEKDIDLHPVGIPESVSSKGIGLNVGASFGYFLSKHFGVGVRYSQFNTWDSFYGKTDSLQTTPTKINNNTFTYYLGVSGLFRYENESKNLFIAEASLGYINYLDMLRNNGAFLVDLTGSSIAGYFKLGYDLRQWKNVGIGFSVSYTLCFLNYMRMETDSRSKSVNFNGESGENLGRLDFTIGFRFYK